LIELYDIMKPLMYPGDGQRLRLRVCVWFGLFGLLWLLESFIIPSRQQICPFCCWKV